MQGLTEPLNALGISTMPSPSGVKRKLAGIYDSGESEDEPGPPKSKKSQKRKKILEIFDEDWKCNSFYILYLLLISSYNTHLPMLFET